VLEADPIGRQRVKIGRPDRLVAVAAQVVSAQSIDGDEYHVRFRCSRCPRERRQK